MDKLICKQAVGKRFREIRKANHITQEALADMLEVTPKHISQIELGKTGLSLNIVVKFAHLLNCSMDYLIFGNSANRMLDKLPTEILSILYSGNPEEIERLERYLNMYIEMHQQNK